MRGRSSQRTASPSVSTGTTVIPGQLQIVELRGLRSRDEQHIRSRTVGRACLRGDTADPGDGPIAPDPARAGDVPPLRQIGVNDVGIGGQRHLQAVGAPERELTEPL